MPAQNSYIMMSTVSKQFLKELHNILEKLNINGMDIQGINTDLPVHMTIGQAIGSKQDNVATITYRHKELKIFMEKIRNTNYSMFMLPVEIKINKDGTVLLAFEPVTGIQDSSDIKKLNQEVIEKFKELGLQPDTRFEYLPHITIGKINSINAKAMQELNERKKEIFSKIRDTIRTLNIYDLKLEYNPSKTHQLSSTEKLFNQALPRRNYSIISVVPSKIQQNSDCFIVNISDKEKAERFAEFLYNMGIYRPRNIQNGLPHIRPKKINTNNNGSYYTIKLTAEEKDRISGIVEGISSSNLLQRPVPQTQASSSRVAPKSSISSKKPLMFSKQYFAISKVQLSTTGKYPGSSIVTIQDKQHANQFAHFLGQQGIYQNGQRGILKQPILQANGKEYTMMLHQNEIQAIKPKVMGL